MPGLLDWFRPSKLQNEKASIQAVEGQDPSVYALLDPRITEVVVGSPGNYATYEQKVRELYRRWNGDQAARWGVALTQTLIEYRAGWIAGNGANFTSEDPRTQQELDKFVQYNKLDSTFFRELCYESDIEAKLLLKLSEKNEIVDGVNELNIDVQHVSWYLKQYKVECDDDDYETIRRIKIPGKNSEPDVNLTDPDRFVFAKFGGSRANVNTPPPRLGSILWDIEVVDRARDDLRQINHKFGAAFPAWVGLPDVAAVNAKRKQLLNTHWRIGHADVTTGDIKYVEPSGSGAAQINQEIIGRMLTISSRSGVPVFLLGHVELMSNRATATELQEQINSMTATDRETYADKFRELGTKAMRMLRARGVPVMPETVRVSIPLVTMHQVEQLLTVYMPLYQQNAIDLQTLLERVPGIDPTEVMKRVEDRQRQQDEAAIMAFQQRQAMIDQEEESDGNDTA